MPPHRAMSAEIARANGRHYTECRPAAGRELAHGCGSAHLLWLPISYPPRLAWRQRWPRQDDEEPSGIDLRQAFVISGQRPKATGLGKGSFDHPWSRRLDLAAFRPRQFDDFESPLGHLWEWHVTPTDGRGGSMARRIFGTFAALVVVIPRLHA